ncbi:hypothetical protein [Winogradskyella sp.]|uniref:hypothetical protein n=1 Tax=Winogradskyella sp. TaxID=1883156 RepID=UPI0025DAC6E2|nr:hypothetical protein [Winogradskyella sp.]
MKKDLTLLVLLFITCIGYAQNGINYKAVIKDDLGNVVANDLIQVQFNILQGAISVYSETHSPTTDDNGIIIINIGEGALVSGSPNFTSIDWANDIHFLEVFINIGDGLINVGTTEFKTVPYALTSGDKSWEFEVDNVYVLSKNVGIGTNTPTELLHISDEDKAGINLTVPSYLDETQIELKNGVETGSHSFFKISNQSDTFKIALDTDITTTVGYEDKLSVNSAGLALQNGTSVNEFSTDITLSDNSNSKVPTERAVKSYVDDVVGNQVIFKVRGNGFAVKDIDGLTEVETDIWDIEVYDTANAFNTATDRFVAPSSGYYFLHACIRQSNFVTTAFFRLRFNVDTSARYSTYVDEDDVKTEVSGVYFLNASQEVYVLLRNYSAGENERMDGSGSWFEGYKL